MTATTAAETGGTSPTDARGTETGAAGIEAGAAGTEAGPAHRVHLPLRVSDFLGTHVNNVRFQEFAQEARILWFREKFDVPDSRVPIALARWMEIDFRKVIGMGVTEVWVDVQVLQVGRTSYTMRTAIGSQDTGPEPCAVIDTVMVVTAADEVTTVEITPEERRALLGAG